MIVLLHCILVAMYLSVSHQIGGNRNFNTIEKCRQQSLETEFSIVIWKWQSKTLFLAIIYPRSSIVKSVFDCRLSSVSVLRFFLAVPWVCM